MKIKRYNYNSFEEFENDEAKTDREALSVIVENGWMKSDIVTECKSWKTALRRFWEALDPNNDTPALDGWREGMTEAAENGCFKLNDSRMADGSRNQYPSYAYEIEQLDDGLWHIFLNVRTEDYPTEETDSADEIPEDIKTRFEALVENMVENDGYSEEDFEDVDIVEAWDEDSKQFSVFGREYFVMTDKEADEATAEYIKESLWAFNADFILSHCEQFGNTSVREFEEAAKAVAKMQETLCESANPIVAALITDIDDFIRDAVMNDGRGAFLSSWNGCEEEENGFYIYRNN